MKKLLILFISISVVIIYPAFGQRANKNEVKTKGAYYTGKYRNLFLENGHSRKEIRSKNEVAFQQLFHGDSATRKVYFEVGKNSKGPLAYVSDVLHNDIRSEGMSYGMMIAVQMNKKAEFDAIWNYAMCLLYTSPSPRDRTRSRMPSSA